MSVAADPCCKTSGLTVDVVTTPEGLQALEPEWNAILEDSESPNIFLSWEWISAWWRHFHSGLELWTLTARDGDGRLIGIAPWTRRSLPLKRLGPYHELGLLGAGPATGDHLDVISRADHTEDVASVFFDRLERERWDGMRLDGLSASSAVGKLLLRRKASPWNHVSELICPYTPLPETWEEFERRLARKVRYNLRSRARRLQDDSDGHMAYRAIEREDEIPRTLAALARLKDRAGLAFAVDKKKLTFHERIARSFLGRGWLRLYLLEVSGETVAISYCFRYRDRTSFLQTGYDESWARYGPGALITAHSIREAIDEGSREFDFLRGDHPYKFQFTDLTRRDYKTWLAPTFSGKLAVSAYRTIRGARAAIRAARRPR